MQYFKPDRPEHFVGDCMPFSHDGVFHLYYLLDENHHRGLGGKGGHQWAHASTRDLIAWDHHGLAIPLGARGELDDGSICTGSVFFHEGVYYAFYAARSLSCEGERICLATSRDAVGFRKHAPQPLIDVPPGYSRRSFRDPAVFRDPAEGRFHMLVTTCRDEPHLGDRAGCLAHLVSDDLLHWQPRPPFVEGLFGRLDGWQAPECPDYFRWADHYYILYGDCRDGRTHYLVSDAWDGPWRRPPAGALDSPMVKVMKTAAFADGRRIGAAFVASRCGPADDAGLLYAGNAVFRELVQDPDGSLGTKWPPEMDPAAGRELPPALPDVTLDSTRPTAALPEAPPDAAVMLRVDARGAGGDFGVRFRGLSAEQPGYELRLSPGTQAVALGRAELSPQSRRNCNAASLDHVTGLADTLGIQIVMRGDLIDVCIDQRRTLCLRLGEIRGRRMSVFREPPSGAPVRFHDIRILPLPAGEGTAWGR